MQADFDLSFKRKLNSRKKEASPLNSTMLLLSHSSHLNFSHSMALFRNGSCKRNSLPLNREDEEEEEDWLADLRSGQQMKSQGTIARIEEGGGTISFYFISSCMPPHNW